MMSSTSSSSSAPSSLRTAVRLLRALQSLTEVVPSIGHVEFPESLRNRGITYREERESSNDRDEVDNLYSVLGEACGNVKAIVPVVIAAGKADWIIQAATTSTTPAASSSTDAAASSSSSSSTVGMDTEIITEKPMYPPTMIFPGISAIAEEQLAMAWKILGYSENEVTKLTVDWNQIYSGPICEMPLLALERMWSQATVSPFGDVASQTTVVDPSIRNARELLSPTNFNVNPLMCKRLSELWGAHMIPRRVRVEPYKLNVYGPGGRFAPHKDTPAAGLVGTILVGLGDTTDDEAGLKISTKKSKCLENGKLTEVSEGVVWRADKGSLCCFYPDVTHEVLPIKSGMRGTLAFKVFADDTKLTPNEVYSQMNEIYELQQLQEITQSDARDWYSNTSKTDINGYLNDGDDCSPMEEDSEFELPEQQLKALLDCPSPFGLLLDHFYTQETQDDQLRGGDAMIYQLLAQSGQFDLNLLPVLISVSESGRDEYPQYGNSCPAAFECSRGPAKGNFAGVFPATEPVIEFVASKLSSVAGESNSHWKKVPRRSEDEKQELIQSINIPGVSWTENIPFYMLSHPNDKEEHRLLHTLETHGGHHGNDSSPSEAQSIYLHRALIVRRKEATTGEGQ